MPGALRVPELARLLASGGDERITLDAQTGLNRYHSGPYPRAVQAYASSTSNDISPAAFAHVARLAASPEGTYPERLERLRGRIRRAYRLPDECEIVFAPSGTDLEYVALAAFAAQAPGGIHNVLLGADEVGSGCRLSAHGRFHALTTARGIATTLGEPVAGLENVSLVDVPVRCAKGLARGIDAVADIVVAVEAARAMGRHPLVHVVHGSKTGMILPELSDIDRLAAAEGERAGPLPMGLVEVFRRAEWPEHWPGRELLADEGNPGLWLRLEAALFELEQFQALEIAEIERMLDAFQRALESELVGPLGLSRVDPYPPGREIETRAHPIEMRTLVTLDVSSLAGARTFDEAKGLHRSLALAGMRLGQPVRCVRAANGEWGGTLRIGLSMPQLVDWSRLDDATLRSELCSAMAEIADALSAVRRVQAA